MSVYTPQQYFLTNSVISELADISFLVGKVSVTENMSKNPTLRRKNRIKTVCGSLAIEQNILSVEQVTAVLDGKHVLAPPEDIAEVKNAYEIYENLDKLDPYSIDDLLKAHSVMLRGLTDEAGSFRTRPVGVADSNTGEIIHFGTLARYVPEQVEKLLAWAAETNVHALIKGCVVHYELEAIHPFIDGNGRIGRLWHTLILSKSYPVFAWLPVESIIQKRQNEYYTAINNCNLSGDSTEFIAFMLSAVKTALQEAMQSL